MKNKQQRPLRGPVAVILTKQWRRYVFDETSKLESLQFVGIVMRENGETGALARVTPRGNYVIVNGNTQRTLEPGAVEWALYRAKHAGKNKTEKG